MDTTLVGTIDIISDGACPYLCGGSCPCSSAIKGTVSSLCWTWSQDDVQFCEPAQVGLRWTQNGLENLLCNDMDTSKGEKKGFPCVS